MSSSSNHGALVVVGSGPGIGVHVAAAFASHGFKKIILLSRNAERLLQDADAVKNKSNSAACVHTISTEIADTAKLQQSLAEVDRLLDDTTPLECVLFNAARVGLSKLLEFPVSEIEADLRTTVTGLYTTAQWALPHLLKLTSSPAHKPSFLVTNSMLHSDPYPHLFSLSLCKAAQYNLTQSLAREYGPRGIHCALVVVCEPVHDGQRNANARNIGERAWEVYAQGKEEWTLAVVVEDREKKVRQEEDLVAMGFAVV